jgi:hypothetical protein
MAGTPRYRADGSVKVVHRDSQWLCGSCGALVAMSWGFREQSCPRCDRLNIPDFAEDLLSERMAHLALKAREVAHRHDSIQMTHIAEAVASYVEEIRTLEQWERTALSGLCTLPEPDPTKVIDLYATGYE